MKIVALGRSRRDRSIDASLGVCSLHVISIKPAIVISIGNSYIRGGVLYYLVPAYTAYQYGYRYRSVPKYENLWIKY